MRHVLFKSVFGLTLLAGLASSSAKAQTLGPAFSGNYSILDLGAPTGVLSPLGGLNLLAGSQNTLLIGGRANNSDGAIYSIGVTRDALGHITGFSGSASLYATAPSIDGGLAYAPNGTLLFTQYSQNGMGQIRPGSSSPDKTITLTGVDSSVGALGFVPSGFANAGAFKIVSYTSGGFYNATLNPDGAGTFDLGSVSLATTLTGGPEGFVYVPAGSPVFSGPSMLVSEYVAGVVSTYRVDGLGNPILNSRDVFISGLTGAEGALIDPLTGDFLFSTFGGGDRVIAVRGFAAVPEPGAAALMALGLAGLALARRRFARSR